MAWSEVHLEAHDALSTREVRDSESRRAGACGRRRGRARARMALSRAPTPWRRPAHSAARAAPPMRGPRAVGHRRCARARARAWAHDARSGARPCACARRQRPSRAARARAHARESARVRARLAARGAYGAQPARDARARGALCGKHELGACRGQFGQVSDWGFSSLTPCALA